MEKEKNSYIFLCFLLVAQVVQCFLLLLCLLLFIYLHKCDVAFIVYHRSKNRKTNIVWCYIILFVCILCSYNYVKEDKSELYKKIIDCRVDKDLSFFFCLFSVNVYLPISCLLFVLQ